MLYARDGFGSVHLRESNADINVYVIVLKRMGVANTPI